MANNPNDGIVNTAPNQGAQGIFNSSVNFNQITPRQGRSDDALLHLYMSRLRASCNALAFGDPQAGRPGEPMQLGEVFTMLNVTQGTAVLEALQERNNNVLLGAPGGGKTTVLAFIALFLDCL